MSGASRVRLSEREEECLTCYLMACDAGLLYLQELDKVCVCEVCRFTQNVFFSQALTFSLPGSGCLAFLNARTCSVCAKIQNLRI